MMRSLLSGAAAGVLEQAARAKISEKTSRLMFFARRLRQSAYTARLSGRNA